MWSAIPGPLLVVLGGIACVVTGWVLGRRGAVTQAALPQRRGWAGVVLTVAGISAGVVILFLLLAWLFPFTGFRWLPSLWEVQQYVGARTPEEKTALLQARIQAAGILVQTLGGLLLFFTIITSLSTLRHTQEQLVVSREGQITERFTRAIDQLGARTEQNEKAVEVRLGGIYALERISQDSPRDYWTVMEVLAAYVRENAPRPPEPEAVAELPPVTLTEAEEKSLPRPSADVQAAITVIGRRPAFLRVTEGPHQRLNLSRTDLRRVSLSGAHLERANLRNSCLQLALLREAHLEGADLLNASLQWADLTDAHLKDATLAGTLLHWAHLRGAHLEGAVFTDAQGLSQKKIDETCMDENTRLPGGVGPDGQPYRRSSRICPPPAMHSLSVVQRLLGWLTRVGG